MSSSASEEPWTDFDALRHSIKSYTVDKLKQIIQGLSEENNTALSKSGKKQDLIHRIVTELDNYHMRRLTDEWNRARTVIYQVKNTGYYSGSGTSLRASYAHTSAHGASYTVTKSMSNGSLMSNGSFMSNGTPSASTIGRYDPYAPPRRPTHRPSSPAPARAAQTTNIRFKPSPFIRVDQAVSTVQECPESTGNSDRKTAFLQFTLTHDHINKLQIPGSKYQLRLFCTTSTFYTPPAPNSFRTMSPPCPVEFPATCEVRVNGVQLTANLKGIKKKPGTAPPANITEDIRKIAGTPNRIDIVYVNSSQSAQAPPPKKFYLVVMLVEITTVDELVERLKKGKFRSHDDVKAKMVEAASEDDDIVLGKQKMSLKCPLSYTRIKLPCKSEKCVHPQCFEANSWYSVMEQTTTWLCPVCEHVLNPEELVVDGYFAEILKSTPDDVEDVEVEPDGEWHTEDNKYGSLSWLSKHPPKGNTQKSPPPVQARSAITTADGLPTSQSAQLVEDIVILDDSDDEEGLVKKELSPYSTRASTSVAPNSRPAPTPEVTVIDLTLDSDDEGPPPPPPPSNKRMGKRKADDSTNGRVDDASKRPRTADLPSRPAAAPRGESNGRLDGGGSGHPTLASASSPWNATSLSPVMASHMTSQRPMPPSSRSSYVRPPPGLALHDTYIPPPDRYAYSGPSYQETNGSGLPYSTVAPPANDPRRLPPPVPRYTNPYLPRGNGEGAARWP